jgi:serine/threonine protein kinase
MRVAVKAFSKEYLESQNKGRVGLINELEILRVMNHKNIIEFYEIHESKNSLYIVMELLEGGEVFKLSKGKIDKEKCYHIMKSTLEALVYLDSHGIIHRDLKPDNIIFKHKDVDFKDNVIKLVDFGLSSFIDAEEYIFRRCGTPGFVAPEVINAPKKGPIKFSSKCDVFSVGVIFCFMLTGAIPYDGDSFSDVLANNKAATIDFQADYMKNLSPIQFDLLKNMLELDVEKRFSAQDCLNHEYFVSDEVDLEDCLEEIPGELDHKHNIMELRNKYKFNKDIARVDSIHFNPNPDINGETASYRNSVDFSNSKRMSVDSPKISAAGGITSPSFYRYALLRKGSKQLAQEELERSKRSMSRKSKNSECESYSRGTDKRLSRFVLSNKKK